VEAVITQEDVHQIVERANEFLATAKSLLTK
jgi:hypothetical protein